MSSATPEQGMPGKTANSLVLWAKSHPYWTIFTLFLLGLGIPFYLRPLSEWENVFLLASGRLQQGIDFYPGQDGYLYPPFMALGAIPFTHLPQGPARLLYYALNVLCLVFLCRFAWLVAGGKIFRGTQPAPRQEHWVFFLGLACAVRYILDGLAHQQPDLIIGCLLLGGCLALLRSRFLLGATSLGLAAAMKCTPLLWAAYLLWRRRWLSAGWLVAVAIGVNLLPNLVTSPPQGGLWAKEWLARHILPLKENHPGIWGSHIIYNQSLSGMGNRFFVTQLVWEKAGYKVVYRPDLLSPLLLKVIVHGTEVLLLILAAFALGRGNLAGQADSSASPPRQAFEFSLVLLLMVLFSPMSSKPHFCTMILPGFCLARRALLERNKILLGLLAATLVFSVQHLWGEPWSILTMWLGTVTWAAVSLMVGCCYCLLRPLKILDQGTSGESVFLSVLRTDFTPAPENRVAETSPPQPDWSLSPAGY